MEIQKTLCTCSSVVRRSWDDTRKCFRYTAVMQPKSDDADKNIFQQMDMFAKDFRIPLRDEILRRSKASAAAKDGDDEAKLTAWDTIVSAELVGKDCVVMQATVDVKELTNGEFNSYVLEIGDASYEVTSRTIAAISDFEGAVGRTKNQVLRACRGQESEEE